MKNILTPKPKPVQTSVSQPQMPNLMQKPKLKGFGDYQAEAQQIGNKIWDGAYSNLQKAIKQEGNITHEDLKKLARKNGYTPLLAPFPIIKDFASLYNNKKLTDKYKHAYVNCVNAQKGLMNSLWSANLSGLKEYSDVKLGTNTPIASYEDMDANLTGNF